MTEKKENDKKEEKAEEKDKAEEKIKAGENNKTEKKDKKEEILLSSENALKLMYYMIAADGKVNSDEEDKFDLIGPELDPDFQKKKEWIKKECQTRLDKASDQKEYYKALEDGIKRTLLLPQPKESARISPKLLVWNLLVLAYIDGNIDKKENMLLKYIVRKTNIDQAVYLEMESSIQTVMDIERELSWVKATDRKYNIVEDVVEELSKRKNIIFESVKDLISL